MASLFNTTPQNVTMHIVNIYTEEELTEEATSKDFLLVQNEGGRNILMKVFSTMAKSSTLITSFQI